MFHRFLFFGVSFLVWHVCVCVCVCVCVVVVVVVVSYLCSDWFCRFDLMWFDIANVECDGPEVTCTIDRTWKSSYEQIPLFLPYCGSRTRDKLDRKTRVCSCSIASNTLSRAALRLLLSGGWTCMGLIDRRESIPSNITAYFWPLSPATLKPADTALASRGHDCRKAREL